MQVAIYARVSTLNQQQEGTIASQVRLLKQHIQCESRVRVQTQQTL
jgi:DNA invertase Pin-like site-specific DNA recombinase